MTKICFDITLFEGSILDNIGAGQKIGFIPGGLLEKKTCTDHLLALGLIVEDALTPSKFAITKAGRFVASSLFADNNSPQIPPMPSQIDD